MTPPTPSDPPLDEDPDAQLSPMMAAPLTDEDIEAELAARKLEEQP